MTRSSCLSKSLPSGNKVHFVTSASHAALLNYFCRVRAVRAVSFANFYPTADRAERQRKIQTQFGLIGDFEDTSPVFLHYIHDLNILTLQNIQFFLQFYSCQDKKSTEMPCRPHFYGNISLVCQLYSFLHTLQKQPYEIKAKCS